MLFAELVSRLRRSSLGLALTVAALAAAACSASGASPRAVTTTGATPVIGGGVTSGTSFRSIVELAHKYGISVLAPVGLPLGDAYAIEDTAGLPQQYGYAFLGQLGAVNVYEKTASNSGDFGLPAGDYTEVNRVEIKVKGTSGLLISLRYNGAPSDFRWEVLWAENGTALQVLVDTAHISAYGETPAHSVTPGPDVALAVANAIRSIPLSEVDSAGIVPKGAPSQVTEFEGQVSTVQTARAAALLFGSRVTVPPVFTFIHVVHSGWLKSLTVDLDSAGTRRLFSIPASPPTASSPGSPAIEEYRTLTVNQADGVYERIRGTAGEIALLYFSVGTEAFVLEDANGASYTDLLRVATSMNQAGPESFAAVAVGAPSAVGGNVQLPVSTVGTDLAPYSGFNVHLRWDPALFTLASASTVGTVIPSPFCPAPVLDADGAGVTVACTALGAASVTSPGLVATIALTPRGAGCSALHLYTYGPPDEGDTSTGTYTIDAASNTPQTVATVDGTTDTTGQPC